ncbi:5-carboxymethyl-2-hydroxymuconate Delta-isomerase [Phreatobacter aquaticus]|uniref:5-carboxymethyl-2-hydroxymuconate Delta-isomerase n=1 Tax=Phreatobacter aquaticus TaxID=2570229 RepID=A0A4D7QGT7_9HYPH|nr:5-carboxymethyl-2-hydroxymuconate Delta-isomerase [Phreatobacter aquaticus]QCK86468.1 5-carboxymethyl-2-hydroxymuconate Delta-isomerase [Phreatobacter aquaticus]
MPHLVIEYSANLDPLVDMAALCEAARTAAVEAGIFPVGGIRVRAHRCDHAAIADGNPAHAFLDATLKIGQGRDLATKRKAGDHVFAALSRALDPAFAATTVALSFEIREIDELNWKRNSIHDALKRSA